jgi:membrane protein implicated in regulation of membrane protease activity
MESIFGDMDGVEWFFLICGVLGGLFVVIQLVLEIIGFSGHGGDGVEFDVSDTDTSFKILSIHSLTSFLMMFGLTGFALYRQDTMNLIMALIGAMAAGVGAVWVMGRMFGFILTLQSSGTVTAQDALGGEGEVYLNIPPRGSGRVLIRFKKRLREFDAVAEDQEGMRTGERVRVVDIRDNVLVVRRIARPELPSS